jgi:hypothetical protein
MRGGQDVTVTQEIAGRRGQPAVLVWLAAGFDLEEADRWQAAGWNDPAAAARWRQAATGTEPARLRHLEELGYDPGNLQRVSARVRSHAAVWLTATAPPEGAQADGEQRREVAMVVLDRLFPPPEDEALAWVDRLRAARVSMVRDAKHTAAEVTRLQDRAATL